MTYGEFQEQASAALSSLLVGSGETPTQFTMACRHQVLATLRERAHHLRSRTAYGPALIRTSPKVTSVWDHPMAHLSALVDEMDAVSEPAGSPLDLLTSAPRTADDELWRTAARFAFLATTELTGAAQQPWLARVVVGWPLVADMADMVEALALLDQGLARAGLIADLTERTTGGRVLLAHNAGRAARMARSEPGADLATATGAATTPTGVRLVNNWDDMAAAQRRLAEILRPWTTRSNLLSPEDAAGLRVGRAISQGQALFSHRAMVSTRQQGLGDLADGFAARRDAYRLLYASMVRMVDTIPIRSVRPLVQQGEIAVLLRTTPTPRLTEEGWRNIDESSRAVARSLARTMRREGFTRQHILHLEERGLGLPAAVPIRTPQHPFHQACNELLKVGEAPQSKPATPIRNLRNRTELRRRLDEASLPTPRVRL